MLIDKKVVCERVKTMQEEYDLPEGSTPSGDEHWNLGADFASSEYAYEASGGTPDKKWQRTLTARFRYTWTALPKEIRPEQRIKIVLRVADDGSSVHYSKGSHALKMEVDPHLAGDEQSASIALNSGGSEVQFTVASAQASYEIGKPPSGPTEKVYEIQAEQAWRLKEGEIWILSLRLEQLFTWTTIVHTYAYTEH